MDHLGFVPARAMAMAMAMAMAITIQQVESKGKPKNGLFSTTMNQRRISGYSQLQEIQYAQPWD
jgi:hypothetical protein